ncbi:MAG: Do family serine endopeptidase [Micropepsaceae bacterium]
MSVENNQRPERIADAGGNSKPAERPRSKRGRLILGAAAIAILSFAAGGWVFTQQDASALTGGFLERSRIAATSDLPQPIQIAADATGSDAPRFLETGAPFSFANLVEQVSPAVVTILTEREAQANFELPEGVPEPFQDFFRRFGEGPNGGQQRQQPRRAMGSGFFIEADGYLVTNNHVVAEADTITVQLPDGREFEATIIGSDEATDIALLKIDEVTDMPTVEFGDDRLLRVGDWVVAVGNPFGLGGTVTAGIVSSIGRDIGAGAYTDYIQIDAPINQGNSGGPTFDLSGRVVGVNSAIFSPSGGSVGIGFAIPSSTVQEVVAQLRAGGEVTRGWLGVQIQSLTPDMAASMGVPDAKGAIVASVIENSPAERAGFQAGDVITAVDDVEVDDYRDLTRRVGSLLAGDTAIFAVLRGGDAQTISALIERRDNDQLASAAGSAPGQDGAAESSAESLGLRLMPLNRIARAQFNIDESVNGVLVSDVAAGSEASEKGFRPGTVIIAIGNEEVETPDDVAAGIASAREADRESVLLLVTDARGQRFVTLNTEQDG